MDYSIKVENLSKIYRLYQKRSHRMREALHPLGRIFHRKFFALKDLNLTVRRGEILGIVGRNGAGKSTLLQILSGVLEPTAGRVDVRGHVTALLELGAGFNPELTGMENIYFHGTIMGQTRQKTSEMLDGILDFAGIGDYIHQPLKTYSSGMRARLGFAVAAHMNPQILILDEVLAVGDELFKRKCYAKMEEVFRQGCTVLYVSHAINSINEVCSRAVLLDGGELILEGSPRLVTTFYQRMLFDESRSDEEIRREIQELNRDPEAKANFLQEIQAAQDEMPVIRTDFLEMEGEPDQQRALLLPGFTATSTVVTRNADVEIQNVQIQTLAGRRVNFLVTREEYRLRFRVRFGQAFDKVFLGFRVKSIRGSKLLTARLNPGDQPLRAVRAGETIDVDCHWTCNLLTGTYLVDLRVFQEGAAEQGMLALVHDALIFKVQKTALGNRQAGIVFLNHQVNIERRASAQSRRKSPGRPVRDHD